MQSCPMELCISMHSFFPITSLPFPVSFVCFGGAGRRGCVGRWPRNWKMQMGRSITPYTFAFENPQEHVRKYKDKNVV